MASSIARRSTFFRTMMKSTLNATSRSSYSKGNSARSTNILFPNTNTNTNTSSSISQSSSRLLRRELSSLLPVHSAIASACLVSKLSSIVSTSTEGFCLSSLGHVRGMDNHNICSVYEEIVCQRLALSSE